MHYLYEHYGTLKLKGVDARRSKVPEWPISVALWHFRKIIKPWLNNTSLTLQAEQILIADIALSQNRTMFQIWVSS